MNVANHALIDVAMAAASLPRPTVVLLVDDQPMVGEAVRRLLMDEENVEFHYCSNAFEALDRAKKVRPTVILQDLIMPGVDGIELVRQYRADPTIANIPIIVLSTKEEATVKSGAFLAGANDYLVKLPDRIELVARIQYHSAAYLAQIQRDVAYRELQKSQQALLETNLQLQRLTNIDGLTGLSNRRYFDDFIDIEWKQALRSKEPISLLMLDIDHFKQYNDAHGHLSGDGILKAVAQTVMLCFQRPRDLVARFGGEEFVAILPQTAGTDLAMLAQKVVDAVAALGLPHGGMTDNAMLTISAGGATFTPRRGDAYTMLIEAADKALYEAKRLGRNCAVIDGASPNPAD